MVPWRALWILIGTAFVFVPPGVGVAATDEPFVGGRTPEGAAFLGRADAPVVLEEWTDYACPYCRRHFEQTWPSLVERYVRTGKLRIVVRDYPIAELHPTSSIAHVAARCAGAGDVRDEWRLHDALFRQQPQWTGLADPTGFITDLARSLGIDTARLSACMQDGRQRDAVQASVRVGQALQLSGTPSFRIRAAGAGKDYAIEGAQPIERFVAVIDALLAGREPVSDADAVPPPVGEMPTWAKPEGLAPDPKRPGYTVAGDPYKGSPAARVTVIEFIDFECPPCRKHAVEVQPDIDAALVATGQVRWVSKQLPLRSHPHAMLAAVAAECAGMQGRYWPMHDLLFQQVEAWARDDAEAALVDLSSRAELDRTTFVACFNSRQAVERVLDDMYDARGYIERTPSFAIVDGSDKGSVTGPLPGDQFLALLRKQLQSAQQPPPTH